MWTDFVNKNTSELSHLIVLGDDVIHVDTLKHTIVWESVYFTNNQNYHLFPAAAYVHTGVN